MKWSGPQLFRIGVTLVTLIGVVVLAKPCADSVSSFVINMDGSGSAGASKTMPKPGNVDIPMQYETITPNMTEAEMKALIERSKSRAGGGSAATDGSGAATGSAGGSAAPTGSDASGSGASGSGPR